MFDLERSLVEHDGVNLPSFNAIHSSHIGPQDRRYFNRAVRLLTDRKVPEVSYVVVLSVSFLKIRFAQHAYDVDAGPRSLENHPIIACA